MSIWWDSGDLSKRWRKWHTQMPFDGRSRCLFISAWDNGICSVWSAATSQQNLLIVSVKLPSWMFQHQMLLISKYCFWVCVVIRGKKKKTSRRPHVASKCSSVYLFFLRFETGTLIDLYMLIFSFLFFFYIRCNYLNYSKGGQTVPPVTCKSITAYLIGLAKLAPLPLVCAYRD